MRIIPVLLALGAMISRPLIAADAGAAAGSTLVRADAPEVVYEGRTLATSDGTVRMGFPGIVIHLRFKGDASGHTARLSFATTSGGVPLAAEMPYHELAS